MRERLAKLLKDVGAIKFGDFVLSSGQRSNVYVDVKYACTRPEILRLIAKEMAEKLRGLEFDKIACIELGGVPIAVALSIETGKPYVIFRKRRKEYGLGEDFIGDVREGERFVVVEDVTTTGRSAMSVVERVKGLGGDVVAVLCVVDRGARIDNLIPLLRLDDLLTS